MTRLNLLPPPSTSVNDSLPGGSPVSDAVTVGTTSLNVVPGLSPTQEDFYQVVLSNVSTGGQVIYLNDTGGSAVSGKGIMLQPGEKIFYSIDAQYVPPRAGINAVASATGGSLGRSIR